MLLIYTTDITPRVKYAFKQVCTRILHIPVDFTSTIETFIAHNSLKMSYSKQALGKELHVRSHDLLFEQGLNDLDIRVYDWENTKCFFLNGENGHLPFDIFAASFYLLTRYEEYQPHVKDEFGRYMASESLAFKNNFLEQPVVDIWAYKFLDLLKSFYPEFEFPERVYTVKPIMDIPKAFKFKHIGFFNTITGVFNDVFHLKFTEVYKRFSVLIGLRRDPYDTYKYIINQQKKAKTKFVFFFLVGDYTTYDQSISIQNQNFISLIKHVGDYCQVGLKTTFNALTDVRELKKEKLRLEAVTNKALAGCRQSFSKVNLPESYRNLVELEIFSDFTMGFINHIGFRAGTCTPFLFYDLDYEVQTPLVINSFHFMDHSILRINSLLDKEQKLKKIISEVKAVNGTFVPVYHSYTFSDEPKWKHFKALFKTILKSVNETY
jgi:hypothetical protein